MCSGRFGGDTTFDDNRALRGGAIYNGVTASLTPPQDGGDYVFQNLDDEVSQPNVIFFTLQS